MIMDQSVMFVLATFKSSKKIWSEFAISSLMTSQKTMETKLPLTNMVESEPHIQHNEIRTSQQIVIP